MKRSSPPAASLLLTLLAACGGGGSGKNAPPLDVLLVDAPIDDLTGFTVTIDSLRLLDAAGSPSTNLLVAPTAIDVKPLAGVHHWLWTGSPPSGTWTAIELGFDTTSVRARALDGTPVAVNPLGSRLVVTPPVPIDGSSYRRIEVDLDLVASLLGDVATPPVDFDPTGTALELSGDLSLAAFDGRVASASVSKITTRVQVFADGDLSSTLGQKTVRIPQNGVLLQQNGQPYPDLAAFLAGLQPGSTVLETTAVLGDDGVLRASRIDVRSLFGGPSPTVAEIHGFVSALSPGGFDLQIAAVTRGASVAEPVLLTLGDPAVVSVSTDATTIFVDPQGAPATIADLIVGQRVDVEFSDFTNPPFPVRRVDLLAPLTVTGTLLSPIDPSGTFQLSSSTGTWSVRLARGARVLLAAGPGRELAAAALRPGWRVRATGLPDGGAPRALLASELWARAGHLRGVVTSASEGLAFLTVAVEEVTEAFGGARPGGPVYVTLDGAARVRGDVASAPGLFELFKKLAPGQALEVELAGQLEGTDEIRAFELEARVR